MSSDAMAILDSKSHSIKFQNKVFDTFIYNLKQITRKETIKEMLKDKIFLCQKEIIIDFENSQSEKDQIPINNIVPIADVET